MWTHSQHSILRNIYRSVSSDPLFNWKFFAELNSFEILFIQSNGHDSGYAMWLFDDRATLHGVNRENPDYLKTTFFVGH